MYVNINSLAADSKNIERLDEIPTNTIIAMY